MFICPPFELPEFLFWNTLFPSQPGFPCSARVPDLPAGYSCKSVLLSGSFSENTGSVAPATRDVVSHPLHPQGVPGWLSSLVVASWDSLLRAAEMLYQSHGGSRDFPRTASVPSGVPWLFLTQELKIFWGLLQLCLLKR